MSEQPSPAADVIPPRARTLAYLTCLVVNAFSVLGIGIAQIYGGLDADRAAATGGLVAAFVGTLTGILGYAYRPTR